MELHGSPWTSMPGVHFSCVTPAAAGISPVQFNLNSETSRFSGTTSSASQGVAEDHLGFLRYGNGGNWEMFHREGQSSSDAGAPPFLGDFQTPPILSLAVQVKGQGS